MLCFGGLEIPSVGSERVADRTVEKSEKGYLSHLSLELTREDNFTCLPHILSFCVGWT